MHLNDAYWLIYVLWRSQGVHQVTNHYRLYKSCVFTHHILRWIITTFAQEPTNLKLVYFTLSAVSMHFRGNHCTFDSTIYIFWLSYKKHLFSL